MHFSVVIPLFNKEKNIQRALESVLNQTYQSFEIIIVDDGSNDNSVEKVKEVSDSRIKLLQQKNRGVSSARNRGISYASYNYIALLDADDTWKPDFLANISFLINTFPHAGAYGTSYEFVKPNDKVVPRKAFKNVKKNQGGITNFFKESVNTPLFSGASPVFSASSVVIPKYVFNYLGGFPQGITKGEDLDMWIRIGLNYPVALMNKVCATYYLNACNRTSNESREYSKSLLSYIEEILATEKRNRVITPEFEEYMIGRIIVKAGYLIEHEKYNEAKTLLKEYKNTKYFKKRWWKNYLLTFKLVHRLYIFLRKGKSA